MIVWGNSERGSGAAAQRPEMRPERRPERRLIMCGATKRLRRHSDGNYETIEASARAAAQRRSGGLSGDRSGDRSGTVAA